MNRAQAAAAAGGEAGSLALVLASVAIPIVHVPALASPFLEPKLALLLLAGALGLGGAALGWASGGRRLSGGNAPWLALAAVVVTSGLSAAVARARGGPGLPYAGEDLARWLAMTGVAVAAARAAAEPDWRARLVMAIHVGAGVVALLGLLQHLQVLPIPLPVISVPGSTFGNRNMGGEAVALAIPFALAALSAQLRGESGRTGRTPARIWIVGVIVGLDLLYVAFTRARGAWVGTALGIAAFVIARRPRLPRRVWLLAAPAALVMALAAAIPGRWIPRDANDTKRFQSGTRLVLEAVDPASPVVRTRLALWRRTLALWWQHPWTGAGVGAFPVLFPTVAEPNAARDGVMTATVVPGRVHNDLLERLAETGVLGAAALLALFGVGLGLVPRRRPSAAEVVTAADAVGPDDARAASIGAVAATLGCGLFAFPLAMPGTAFLFSIAIGFAAVGSERPCGLAPPRGTAAVGLAALAALLLAAGAGTLAARGVAASWWVARAERAIAGGDGAKAGADPVAALGRAEALALPRARFAAALRTGQLAARLGRPETAEAAASRALALEPFSPHALALRGSARLALGDPRRAAADAAQALSLFADLPAAQTTLEEARRRLDVGTP